MFQLSWSVVPLLVGAVNYSRFTHRAKTYFRVPRMLSSRVFWRRSTSGKSLIGQMAWRHFLQAVVRCVDIGSDVLPSSSVIRRIDLFYQFCLLPKSLYQFILSVLLFIRSKDRLSLKYCYKLPKPWQCWYPDSICYFLQCLRQFDSTLPRTKPLAVLFRWTSSPGTFVSLRR